MVWFTSFLFIVLAVPVNCDVFQDNTVISDEFPGEPPLSRNVFRQLLNQETLIRMSLVKNVQSLMQDMVTQKEMMLKLQSSMEKMALILEEQNKTIETRLSSLNTDNQETNRRIVQLEEEVKDQNLTEGRLDLELTNVINIQQSLKEELKLTVEELKRNASDAMSDVKVETRLLSMSVMDLDQRADDVKKRLNDFNKSVPQLFEKYQIVTQRVGNLFTNLSVSSDQELNEIKSDLKKTQKKQLKLSAAVLSLEWFRNNASKGNCELTKLTNVSKKVGFTDGLRSSNSGWSSDKLVFTEEIYNYGGGYDSSSGVFTAPASGVYVFFVSLTSYEHSSVLVDIVVNGTSKVRARANGGRDTTDYDYFEYQYQTGTNMVVTSLDRGKKVWVECHSGAGYYSETVPVSTFSGFMI
ncbi:multimerin-2-like [Saccostrea echinata]|uniref:multimerin-2-like n=1 Tax=Saccostrea echinata TaxID=191078 RepID=UPI002A81ED07|nr:multimerin-2-like [Saccostrea echinata]